MAALFSVFFVVLAYSVVSQDPEGISYNEDCQWIGGDGMAEPMLPIGVCKHIYSPDRGDGTPHRYSTKYVCSEDGNTVYAHVWQNNSFCEGDNYDLNVAKTYGDNYFSCAGNKPCPYATVRFHHQTYPNYTNTISTDDYCELSDDGWYSEAPMTVYQCLNISDDWYMMTCTPDGKGLIGTDYTPNCKQKLNESIFYDGCNYKDRYIKIMHCDYWNGVDPISTTTSTAAPDVSTTSSRSVSTSSSTSTSTSTSASVSETETTDIRTTATDNSIITKVLSTLEPTVVIDSDSSSGSHQHHGHHHGSGSHDGSDSHDGRHHGRHNSHDGDHEEEHGSSLHPLLFIVSLCLFFVCSLLCCCMTYKYYKQKKQMAQFVEIVDGIDNVIDIEGDKDDFTNQNNVDTLLNKTEGEITFK